MSLEDPGWGCCLCYAYFLPNFSVAYKIVAYKKKACRSIFDFEIGPSQPTDNISFTIDLEFLDHWKDQPPFCSNCSYY